MWDYPNLVRFVQAEILICPDFQARDALIQADVNRYKGANKCLLWKIFASRGFGKDAVVNPPYKDGTGVPSECFSE